MFASGTAPPISVVTFLTVPVFAVFAVLTAILVPRSERYVDAANAAAAERQRAATQLHSLFLRPAAAMELRVFGCADRLDRRSDELWREVADVQLRGAVRSAVVAGIGWTTLTFGYVFALLFVMFDVEAVFIFPWAIRLEALGVQSLISMIVFIGILALGLVYAWRKGVLRWA